MSLSKFCHYHPCQRPKEMEPCPAQGPLGVAGSINLCFSHNHNCRYRHSQAWGCYDWEDILFPVNWEETEEASSTKK